MRTVTYLGPRDYLVVTSKEGPVELPAGTPMKVTNDLADSLSSIEGHRFKTGRKTETPTPDNSPTGDN